MSGYIISVISGFSHIVHHLMVTERRTQHHQKAQGVCEFEAFEPILILLDNKLSILNRVTVTVPFMVGLSVVTHLSLYNH
ncbi:hypothetical protein F5Y19DRAFT_58161 [Xylariaceae sp. FL1651]|nr:hypothetical protein F5Y19DRAFT_58161 [Xylariaceae sp. FL1651]